MPFRVVAGIMAYNILFLAKLFINSKSLIICIMVLEKLMILAIFYFFCIGETGAE